MKPLERGEARAFRDGERVSDLVSPANPSICVSDGQLTTRFPPKVVSAPKVLRRAPFILAPGFGAAPPMAGGAAMRAREEVGDGPRRGGRMKQSIYPDPHGIDDTYRGTFIQTSLCVMAIALVSASSRCRD